MTEDQCRRNAERLLGQVAQTSGVEERRRLIDEAMRWHHRAMAAHDEDLGPGASARKADGEETPPEQDPGS